MIRIRPVEKPDYTVIAEILNAVNPEPTSAEERLHGDERAFADERIFFNRLVAVDEANAVLGMGFVRWEPEMVAGTYSLGIAVLPAHRRRGIGHRLFEAVAAIAREKGATAFEAWTRGEDEASFEWAVRRGFELNKQRTESILDLTTFDMTRFAGVVDGVRAGGLTLLGSERFEDDLLYKVYEVDVTTTPDIPAFQEGETLPEWDVWKKGWYDYPNERYVALALDGDKPAGVSMVFYPKVAGGGAYTGYTGIMREYRGRHLALALKLMTIEHAIGRGMTRMRTNNDPDNPSMLAVNARLGYVLVPGPRRLKKEL